jgi:nucleoside-triphosphatase THEP1
MNLAQALKSKVRLEKKANELLARIKKYNKTNVKNTSNVPDMTVLLAEWDKVNDEMSKLKQKIATATTPVMNIIFQQAMLRKLINVVKELDCDPVGKKEYYAKEEPEVYKIQLNESNRDSLVEEIQKDIDAIQDKLDDFNAITMLP